MAQNQPMANTPRDQQYAQALDDLTQQREAGQIGQGMYEVQHAKLIAEVARPRRTSAVSFLIGLGTVIGVLMVLYAVGRIVAFFIDLSA